MEFRPSAQQLWVEAYVIKIKENTRDVTVRLNMEGYFTERLHPVGDNIAVGVLKKMIKEILCIKRHSV